MYMVNENGSKNLEYGASAFIIWAICNVKSYLYLHHKTETETHKICFNGYVAGLRKRHLLNET